MSANLNAAPTPLLGAPMQNGKFENLQPFDKNTFSTLAKVTWRMLSEKRIDKSPRQAIPVHAIDVSELSQPGIRLYRLGHSSSLLSFHGELWLIDPVFSMRVSPVQFMGPQRFHQPPISIAQLPNIKGVIISHDHYDHLDKGAIMQLQNKVEHFVTPLRVGQLLKKWGVSASKIHELDWWQELQLGSLNIAATPAQHFSGRGLSDGDHTLWASWVIRHDEIKLFYSGDSGYFDGFKRIGEVYGPFDVTLIENGAYDNDWPHVHMSPEQSLQAHLDVKGGRLLPVHNSTFDLAMHAWYEPLERLRNLAMVQHVELLTPEIGQPVSLLKPSVSEPWWHALNAQAVHNEQVAAQ